jgi:hypothetical protein
LIGYTEGLNLFEYVASNSVIGLDPNGLAKARNTKYVYLAGEGTFKGSLSVPRIGDNNKVLEASADFAMAWASNKKSNEFTQDTCCKSVGFVQIYHFVHTGSQGMLNYFFGLVENQWTIDTDAGMWYGKVVNGVNSGQAQGPGAGNANMIDAPGFGGTVPGGLTSANYDYETCAVCMNKGCGGNPNLRYVFGCFTWGMSFTFASGVPTARRIYLDTQSSTKTTPPPLPPQKLTIPPPNAFGGGPPSATMMGILGGFS